MANFRYVANFRFLTLITLNLCIIIIIIKHMLKNHVNVLSCKSQCNVSYDMFDKIRAILQANTMY